MRRHNPAGPSSKADLIESLLRLGDITRNNAVGEVQVALGKAKLLMEKYGLLQFDGRYQQLVEKMAAFLRGEKVEATKEEPKAKPRSSYEDWWKKTDRARADRAARERAAKDAHKQAQKDARSARTAQRKAARKATRAEARKAYVKPHPTDRVMWLWTLTHSTPRRGAAGVRWKKYYGATTIADMIARGATRGDIKKNIIHGYMRTEAAT
mgnify:CR=1 FL=1